MKSATFVHACFGSIGKSPCARSAATSGASTTTAAGGVAEDLDCRVRRHEGSHELLRRRGRAIGRIAEVQRGDRLVGDDVVRQAPLDPGHRDDLVERQAVDDRLATLVGRRAGETLDRAVDGVVGEPWARGVPADAAERDASGEVADAACLDGEIGRLEQDCEIGLVDERARIEQRGQRVVLRRQLLAAEQQQGDVDRPGVEARELRTSSTATATPPFMSLAPQPCTAPPSRRPGMFPWAGTVS